MGKGLYVGRLVDPSKLEELDKPYMLDPDDLTTHGIIIGMTGSGKTGAAVVLIEELLLQGIPVVIIDPKGDAVNVMLRPSNYSMKEFLKWIDPIQARKEGLTPEEYAERLAKMWRKGIESYGQSIDKARKLTENSEVIVLTPGSDAGIPISVIHDLNMPEDLNWEEHGEVLLEKIKNIVSALLQLAGRESDPLKSNEHILLSHILEYCWRKGEHVDFNRLLAYVLDPPFNRIGVIDVDMFISEKDRRELVIALNRVIASPTFRNWIKGMPLDFDKLLWTSDGKPRAVVFYLAHLDEQQKMFAVTLVLQNLYGWMFRKAGSSKLRTLVYFDEVYGYIPPYPRNPPSKHLLMLLLKQARAFGVGVVLSTQNPVDIDYKALTNAGIWMIGRLQTENDKARVMEGLKLASSTAGTSIKEGEISRIISSLAKRVFLVHNVHENKHILFKTRWALTYLRGPLTLMQIENFMKDFKDKIEVPHVGIKAGEEHGELLALPPKIGSVLDSYFLPVQKEIELEGVKAYYPLLFFEAKISMNKSRPRISHEDRIILLVEAKDNLSLKDFARNRILGLTAKDINVSDFSSDWEKDFRFFELSDSYSKNSFCKRLIRMAKDFIVTNYRISIFTYEGLKIYSEPGESLSSFALKVRKVLRELMDKEFEKKKSSYTKKLEKLKSKIDNKKEKIELLNAEIAELKKLLAVKGADVIFSVFRRRSSLTKLSTAERIRERIRIKKKKLRQLEEEVRNLEREFEFLKAEMKRELAEVIEKYEVNVDKFKKIDIKPSKREVEILHSAILWIPLLIDKGNYQPLVNLYTGQIFS